jgi:tetratricopeptide (TPR) repeat protein
VVVCTVFYYSARYRLVAAPALCALAGLGLTRWRELGWPRSAVLAVVLAPLALLAWNAATGFESLDFMREDYARALATQHVRAGTAREQAGDATAAAAHYRRAVRADPSNRDAWAHLHDLAVARQDYHAARSALIELLARAPEDQPAHLALAWLLASCPDASLRDGEAALRHAREALRLSADASPEALLVLALAEAESHRFAAAAASARRGADLARAQGDTGLARDLGRLAETVAARHAISTPPRRLLVARAP